MQPRTFSYSCGDIRHFNSTYPISDWQFNALAGSRERPGATESPGCHVQDALGNRA